MLNRIISNKKYDSIFLFLETRLISILIPLIFIFILGIHLLSEIDFNTSIKWILKTDEFLKITLTEELKIRDSTLISLASIFIGVYFTAFTLLTTISYKSTISLLNKAKFKNLINYIRNAFIAAFSYVIFSLLYPLFSIIDWAFTLVVVPLLLYIFLSALRFGWLIYLILIKDLQGFIDRKDEVESKELRFENVLTSLEIYLKKIELEEKKKKQEKTDALIESRKNHPPSS